MTETTITVQQAPLPQAPVDTSVSLPPSVRAAAAAADAAHATAYNTPQPDPVQVQPQPQPDPSVQAQPLPQGNEPDPRASWTAEQWAHHARSMEGRWKSSQQQIEGMQGQMSELGDELLRSQALLNTKVPFTTDKPQANVKRLLTPEDETAYGTEMLDVVKRAALEAVAPELDALRQENTTLRQTVQRNTAGTVAQVLDAEVPTWRAVNVDPKFKNWLRLRDIYSGQVKQGLLEAAYKAANAARVVAFFKGFLAENPPDPGIETSEPSSVTAPRTPAMDLASLTAPGHAKPAPGSSLPQSAEKPILTRGQISQFYVNVRRGVYNGREADKANDEAIIFAAQREGRVR
jgi:hypothetical protein